MHKKLEDILKKSIGIALVSLPLIFYGCGKKGTQTKQVAEQEISETQQSRESEEEFESPQPLKINNRKYSDINLGWDSFYFKINIGYKQVTDLVLEYNIGRKQSQWLYPAEEYIRDETSIFYQDNLDGGYGPSKELHSKEISMIPQVEAKKNRIDLTTYIFADGSWLDNKKLEIFYGEKAVWGKERGKRKKIDKNDFDLINKGTYRGVSPGEKVKIMGGNLVCGIRRELKEKELYSLKVDWKIEGEDDWSPLIYIRSLQNPGKKYGLFSDKSSNQILYKVKRFGKYRE